MPVDNKLRKSRRRQRRRERRRDRRQTRRQDRRNDNSQATKSPYTLEDFPNDTRKPLDEGAPNYAQRQQRLQQRRQRQFSRPNPTSFGFNRRVRPRDRDPETWTDAQRTRIEGRQAARDERVAAREAANTNTEIPPDVAALLELLRQSGGVYGGNLRGLFTQLNNPGIMGYGTPGTAGGGQFRTVTPFIGGMATGGRQVPMQFV